MSDYEAKFEMGGTQRYSDDIPQLYLELVDECIFDRNIHYD